jgi:hypothetical protein
MRLAPLHVGMIKAQQEKAAALNAAKSSESDVDTK